MAIEDTIKIAQSVMVRQKGEKRDVIERIINIYRIILYDLAKYGNIYVIMKGFRCKKCGGIILRVVFPGVTFGGNSKVGCPKCGTIRSDKMISFRDDIEFDPGRTP